MGISLICEKIHEDAKLPTRATSGSAGYDIYALEDADIYPGVVNILRTGLKVEIPEGYFMYVSSKSGLAANYSVQIFNSPGLVDNDYRQEIYAILQSPINMKYIIDHIFSQKKMSAYHVKKGDKIAQFVILPIIDVDIIGGKVGPEKERKGGLGSTGK